MKPIRFIPSCVLRVILAGCLTVLCLVGVGCFRSTPLAPVNRVFQHHAFRGHLSIPPSIPAESVEKAVQASLNAVDDFFGNHPEPPELNIRFFATTKEMRRAFPHIQPHSLAFQSDQTIQVVWEAGKPGLSAMRLAHEIGHWAVQFHLPDCELPLWIDEGIAGCVAEQARPTLERVFQQNLLRSENPPVNVEGESPNPFAFTQWVDYPRNPEKVRLFYLHAERLISAIHARLGYTAFMDYLSQMCATSDWQAPLRDTYYFNERDFQNLAATVVGGF